MRDLIFSLLLLSAAPLIADSFDWTTSHPSGIKIEVYMLLFQEQNDGTNGKLKVMLSYPLQYHVDIEEIPRHILSSFSLSAASPYQFTKIERNTPVQKQKQITEEWVYHIAVDKAKAMFLPLQALHFTAEEQMSSIAIALPIFALQTKGNKAAEPSSLNTYLSWAMLCGISFIILITFWHHFLQKIRGWVWYHKTQRKINRLEHQSNLEVDKRQIYCALLQLMAQEIEYRFPHFPKGSSALPLLRNELMILQISEALLEAFDAFIQQRERILFANSFVSSKDCEDALQMARYLMHYCPLR